MKPREARRKVLIEARLRHECGWADARILNISSRGLMARAPTAPARGSYVEICRGTHRIVARVVWVKDGTFGARAQDMIAIEAIARGEDAPAPAPANVNDRRLRPRAAGVQESNERSRRQSRRLEFLAIATFGCVAASLAFDTVWQTLSKPLALVEARLGGD